uniref:DDE Tnp4 domain-containing protein n=1 Tax=Daphnia galeata TaxID=27404 RepID=A0A8J2RPU8_9CRUS|nr:unnamed protein product [Daphnia galeata]
MTTFIDDVLPQYHNIQFREHFRMSRATFEDFLLEIGENENLQRGVHNEVTLRYRLLVTIWVLANRETFREVADRFDTTRGKTTCAILAERLQDFVRWPNRDMLPAVAAGFDFPGTVGCIDSTDIRIKQNLRHLAAFTNRKSFTSVKMQAVCDSNKKFIDVSCGWPGSMHDSRVFEMSSLSRGLEERLRGLPNYHILGKWRIFGYLDVNNLSFIPDYIAAAVILHNFILDVEGDDEEEIHDSSSDENESDDHGDSEPEDEHNDVNQLAIAKRYRIAHSL